jgi:hypothetical protein
MAKAGVSVGAWSRNGYRCAVKGKAEIVALKSVGGRLFQAPREIETRHGAEQDVRAIFDVAGVIELLG